MKEKINDFLVGFLVVITVILVIIGAFMLLSFVVFFGAHYLSKWLEYVYSITN